MSGKQKRQNGLVLGSIERRIFAPATRVELRAEGEKKGIRGIGIATGVTTDIGPFTEEIDHEALTDEILGQDIRCLYNHDENFVLGRTKPGTMIVRKTDEGSEYEVPEMPASRADVMEAIERGDVDGSSFSFTVEKDEWTRGDETTKPHRKILVFQRLYDQGPVAFPAYEGDAVVSARSLERAADAGAEIPEELREALGEEAPATEEPVVEEPVIEEPEGDSDGEGRDLPADDSGEGAEGAAGEVEGSEGDEGAEGREDTSGAEEERESVNTIRRQLEDALDAEYSTKSDNAWSYVMDFDQDAATVVFRVGNIPMMEDGSYRSSYEIASDGAVTFGDPERVRVVISYEPVAGSRESIDHAMAELRTTIEVSAEVLRSLTDRLSRAERKTGLLDDRIRLVEEVG